VVAIDKGCAEQRIRNRIGDGFESSTLGVSPGALRSNRALCAARTGELTPRAKLLTRLCEREAAWLQDFSRGIDDEAETFERVCAKQRESVRAGESIDGTKALLTVHPFSALPLSRVTGTQQRPVLSFRPSRYGADDRAVKGFPEAPGAT
jgi:hypothetical protein